MKEVNRIEIIKCLLKEQWKPKPSKKVLSVIDKTLKRLYEKEKKQKRIIGYVNLSNKDYSTLFQ